MATAAGDFCMFLVLLLTCVHVSQAISRKVHTYSWPDCQKYSESCKEAQQQGYNVVYSKASLKSNDNLLYAFSTIGLPTVVMARTTSEDMNMEFDWDKLVNKSSLMDAISITGKGTVEYKFGVAFTKLIEYDDRNDTADLVVCEKNKGNFTIRSFEEFTWQPVEKNIKKDTFVFNSSDTFFPPSKSDNGSVSFKFFVRGSDGRSPDLPGLKYTGNETQIEFEIDKYTPSYNNSRFALEVAIVSQSTNKDMSVRVTETIDDEYAPGVFKIADLLSDPARKTEAGFVQWKPVAYFDKSRGRKSATEVQIYTLENLDEGEQLNKSALYAFFGEDLYDGSKVIKRISNISFGLPKDGFYVKNNYTEWTYAVGYGEPPHDAISMTVIIIISAGLGLPVIIIIFGALFTIVRKCRRSSEQQYEPINGSGSINRNNPQ
ncbi:glycosylated lysosomal membrane protein A isoform X2 [Aplysia californica]|nr:glycosylated lysosomal membrane protein A isoform X2 [Aplysia californica]